MSIIETITNEDIKKYIEENRRTYVDETIDGTAINEIYPDLPLPFIDFPEPINEFIALIEIRKNRQWDADLQHDFERMAAGYDVPRDDDKDHEWLDQNEKDDALEKEIFDRLAEKCGIPQTKVSFFLDSYRELYIGVFFT